MCRPGCRVGMACSCSVSGKRSQPAVVALAVKPFQQIAMNAFMMYMSGRQLNIFSIGVCSSAILSPLTSIFNLDATFGPLQEQGGKKGGGDELQLPKFIFVALNLVWLAVGLYKMSTMRLLPTMAADWTSKIVWKEMMELTSLPPDNSMLT